MAVAERGGLFTTKPAQMLVREADEQGHQLRRVVGLLDLSALGLGAIIGTGIFVIIGEAIVDSGPSILLSFVLAGVTCAFSALSYAELASSIPVSGSAYTYAYATLGELVAWIIGWDLILEYGVSVAAISVGWGQYFNELLDSAFGWTLPEAIAGPPGEGGTVNLPAVFVVLAVAGLLISGVRKSARTNTIMVLVKSVILLLFIALAFTAFNSDNLTPFFHGGLDGVVSAASLIFFAYIGFDAISTSGEETKNPQRDLPIAIIGSLAIATVLYCLVAIAATGALPFDALAGSQAPLATVLEDGAGMPWGATVISVGALIAITSVVLTVLYGQTRIMFAMSRDGLVPRRFSRVSERTGTPVGLTAGFALFIAAIAAVVPLAEIAELVNIGTLFAFVLVNVGVIVLRRTRPDMERGFRVPLVPVVPIIGCILCIYLMTQLPGITWLRFGIWMVLGLAIYLVYGRRHSRLRTAEAQPSRFDRRS
ncbi:MAG TPA: amino acid permease [Solirubrobacteraceae bacterium]|nr:amino acid permease [Solirubrobacteraceae bacterium]